MEILTPLLWTTGIESAVLMIGMRLFYKKTDKWLVLYEILINAVTNPLLNLTIATFGIRSLAVTLLLEGLVVCAEAGIYRALTPLPLWNCLALSLLLNASSYFIGLMIL